MPKSQRIFALTSLLGVAAVAVLTAAGCGKKDDAPAAPAAGGGIYNQAPTQSRTPKEEAG